MTVINCTLQRRMIGFASRTTFADERASVRTRELIGPADAMHLAERLDRLQESVLTEIPGLPRPSQIDHLLIVIKPDLSATTYVNALETRAKVQINRSVEAGDPVFVKDVAAVHSVDVGVHVPDDCAVILIQSLGWRRALFYDFGPIGPNPERRPYLLETALAQMAMLLMGMPIPGSSGEVLSTRLGWMAEGHKRLLALLESRCDDEGEYQRLLAEHHWMFGGHYLSVTPHQRYDDSRIPDFTAERCLDSCLDIIEIKQPFLPAFRKSGGFSADFNNAWNQAEDYLAFVLANKQYLHEEKGLRFDMPNAYLVIGYGWDADQKKQLRNKLRVGSSVKVITYEQVVRTSEHLLEMVKSAGNHML